MRVVVVNAKGGQALGPPLAGWLRRCKPRLSPLVALISEADAPKNDESRIGRALATAMPRSRYYQGSATHGAREVAVLVWGRSFKVTSWESVKLTPGSGWSGGGQDRWVTIVYGVHKRRKIALFSTHASTTHPAAIAPPQGQAVEAARSHGYRIIVGGDLNQRNSPGSSWHKWAHFNRLAPHATGVMWAMVDNAMRVRHVRVVSLDPDISDHPAALSVTVKPNR